MTQIKQLKRSINPVRALFPKESETYWMLIQQQSEPFARKLNFGTLSELLNYYTQAGELILESSVVYNFPTDNAPTVVGNLLPAGISKGIIEDYPNGRLTIADTSLFPDSLADNSKAPGTTDWLDDNDDGLPNLWSTFVAINPTIIDDADMGRSFKFDTIAGGTDQGMTQNYMIVENAWNFYQIICKHDVPLELYAGNSSNEIAIPTSDGQQVRIYNGYIYGNNSFEYIQLRKPSYANIVGSVTVGSIYTLPLTDIPNFSLIPGSSGVYQVSVAISAEIGTGNIIYVYIYKNGQPLPKAKFAASTSQQNEDVSVSFSFLTQAGPGDYFEVFVATQSGAIGAIDSVIFHALKVA